MYKVLNILKEHGVIFTKVKILYVKKRKNKISTVVLITEGERKYQLLIEDRKKVKRLERLKGKEVAIFNDATNNTISFRNPQHPDFFLEF